MAKKAVTFNISDRVAALKLFDEFKGNISALAAVFDDVKGLAVTNEEWEAAKLVKTPAGEGNEAWSWEDKDTEKEFTISDEGVEYLRAKIKAKSDAGELGLADKGILTLKDKIN